MKLTRGYFNSYSRVGDSNIVNESYSRTRYFSSDSVRSASGNTVFISHKHSDLDDLKGLLNFLKRNYNVIPYIDSMDKRMPEETCGDTAVRIKQVISTCNRFLLLATNKALASMWCNWEVGIADKLKLPANNMAILPMVDSINSLYDGNEYLEIYPYVDEWVNYDGKKQLTVVYKDYAGKQKRVSIKDWLSGDGNY
jgi:hypothetical protein